MKILQHNSDGSTKLTIIIYHKSDLRVQESLVAFEYLSRSNEICNFLGLIVEPDIKGTEAFVLANGAIDEVNLTKVVSSCQNLERIELVTVSTSELSASSQTQLREEAQAAYRNFQISAPQGSIVREHRIYFPSHEKFGDPQNFLTGEADSRLIVMPEDRRNDGAFSRPLSGTDELRGTNDPAYPWHIAVEIISICGFWITVHGSVFEKVAQYTDGTPSPVVQVVRSFARTASSPVTALMEEYESLPELPVPAGLVSAPDPFYLTGQAAEVIYDYDFQLRPENTYQEARQDIESRSLLIRIAKRIWGDLRALGKTLRRRYISNFNESVDEFTQGLIGDNSWLNCLPRPLDERSSSITEEDISAAILELERLTIARKEVIWNGEDRWPLVLRQTLGTIDGNDLAKEIRRDAGSERWVAADKGSIVHGYSEDLAEVIDLLVSEKSANSKTSSINRPGLLQLISRKFHAETIKSKERCEGLLRQIKNLKPEGEIETRAGVSKVVMATFYIALFAMFVSILVFPEWVHQVLDFHEDWKPIKKAQWFWILSFLPALFLAIFVSPSNSQKRQNFMLGFSAIYLILGFFLFGIFPGFDAIPDVIEETIAPVVLILCGLALGYKIFGPRFQKRESVDEVADSEVTEEIPDDRWNSRGKKLLKLTLPPYLFITMILALNDSHIGRVGAIESERGELFWTIFIFSLVMFLVSFTIIDVIRQREETNLRGWKSKYHWLINETRQEFQNYKVVETFESQWLGIAAVLVRLFQFPYGKGEAQDRPGLFEQVPKGELQKLQITALELTEDGKRQFQETASSELVSPGWLTQNYEKMSRLFLEREASSFADFDDQDLTKPESCPYPVTINEAISGNAKGRRWPFCYKVFSGEFDKHLRQGAEQKLTEILLKAFIENPDSYKVTSTDDQFNTLSSSNLGDSFGELLPESTGTWNPAIFGSPVEINYNSANKIKSIIWWPKAVDFPSGFVPAEDDLFLSENYLSPKAVIVQIARVDISETIKLDDLFHRLDDSAKSHTSDTNRQIDNQSSSSEAEW